MTTAARHITLKLPIVAPVNDALAGSDVRFGICCTTIGGM